MSSFRDLFHSLKNKYNMLTVGAGVAGDILRERLSGIVSDEIKRDLEEVAGIIEKINKSVQSADEVTNKIKEKVYALCDPEEDTIDP